MSLQDFKRDFLQETLDLIWSHWCVLGMPGHCRRAGRSCVDPEALVLATCEFGRYDQRLFDGMIGWLANHEETLSLQRMSSLADRATSLQADILPAISGYLLEKHKKIRWKKLAGKARSAGITKALFRYPDDASVKTFGYQDPLFLSYGLSRGRIEDKGTFGNPQPSHPASLWVRLRSLMGVSSRTDILVYLVTHRSGGFPSQIAKELGYTQRGIDKALSSMSDSGWIQRIKRPREVVYTLADPIRIALTSAAEGEPRWLSWCLIYRGLTAIWDVLRGKGLERLDADAEAAELRGVMQVAQPEWSQAGLSTYFLESRGRKGAQFVDALAAEWKSLFSSLSAPEGNPG